MSSTPIDKINEQINKKASFIEFLRRKDIQERLCELNVTWETGQINTDCEAASVLTKEGYFSREDNRLTRMGILLLSRLCIDFSTVFRDGIEIEGKYIVQKPVRVGKNSATFNAVHKVLSSKIILKFIRPGASEDIETSLQILSKIGPSEHIVQPIDFFEIKITDIFGRLLLVKCIVFPYLEGDTLREFLNRNQPLNSHTVISFIKQVGGALAQLERVSAYHGDLHDENIIVNYSNSSMLNFNLIDVSYGTMGSLDSKICHDNDLNYFRQHLWKILSMQQRFLPKMSIRKYLGSKAFNVVSSVLSPTVDKFNQIMSFISDSNLYREFTERKKKFLDDKFSPPSLFKLQRYEEFTDPTVAIKLFVPFPELMTKIKEFANISIAGNRGSGKSTYLAALAFFPKVTNDIVNYRNAFGIYFPCRLGEFRLMSSEMYEGGRINYDLLKQVIIIKIVRRTLEILADAVEVAKIAEPLDYRPLRESLRSIAGVEVFSIDPSIVSEIRNYATTMVRIEMKEVESLYDDSKNWDERFTAKEIDLVNFFKSVRAAFHDLANTQFHLLFDDAGQPHVPEEVQRVLNDLILASNPLYCLKFSAEKLTYSFVSTKEKNVENGHDYFEHDISKTLFMGAKNTGLARAELEKYFRAIVGKRLAQFEYKSDDIVDYLGDNIITHERLINSLSAGRRNAYYCGWSMVWIIADRTPRNLLEMVAEIFSAANIGKDTVPSLVHHRIQNRAIRNISEKRLQSLNHISGVVRIMGQDISLGRRLFEITTTLGSTFRIYLKEERGKKRKRQTLAIERNEILPLITEAEYILQKLITYGILDSVRLDFARDDQVKKPIYVLNRIFCPAFGISPQRDNHLRLSKGKLEQLLLDPNRFISEGTKKLRNSVGEEPVIGDLFGGLDGV